MDDTEIDIRDRSVEKLSCDGERRIRFVTASAGVVVEVEAVLFCDAIRVRDAPGWSCLE